MKVQVKVSPRVIVEAEGDTQKVIFTQLDSLREVFGERACGMCGGEDIMFIRRNVEGNDFFEMACQDNKCKARLSFGQSKQRPGELFPIRKLITSGPERGKPSRKKGEWDNEHNGWTLYRGQPLQEDNE